jgi:hypothetical protein
MLQEIKIITFCVLRFIRDSGTPCLMAYNLYFHSEYVPDDSYSVDYIFIGRLIDELVCH